MKNRDALATFEPMPKRFFVWDKNNQEFIKSIGIFNLYIGACLRYDTTGQMYFANNSDFIVVQSTNLFGKDNKEIFEGSIIEDEDGDRGLVVYCRGALMVRWVNPTYCSYALSEVVATGYKVIGHIFLDPELLEEEK